jgi:hypothetical protein
MTCRHGDPINNPACSSFRTPDEQLKMAEEAMEKLRAKFSLPETPDSERFTIEDFEQVGHLMVVKASYPNCKKCSYEGMKVMVFEGVTVKDLLKWRRIDPHFRDWIPVSRTEAPSPIARFPASPEGWEDALLFAKWLMEKEKA